MAENNEFVAPCDDRQRSLTNAEINYLVLAAIETIRIHQYQPIRERIYVENKADTGTETMQIKQFEPGYIYILTNLCAVDEDNTTTYTRFGYKRGNVKTYIDGGVPSVAGDPVTWAGQIICIEGDVVFAELNGGAANDDLYFFVEGYKIAVGR